MNATLTDLVAGIQDLDSSNSSLATTVVTLQESLSKVNTALAAAQAEVTDLTQQVAAQTSNNQSLADALADALAKDLAKYNQLLAASQAVSQQLSAAQAQLAKSVDPYDVLTGRVTPTVFSNLQTRKRSPQAVGTTVNQDQEITLQWGDAGGTKADSNPNTIVKPHGIAAWSPGNALVPARLSFQPAAAFDNEFFFIPLPTPSYVPKRFFSSRTYQFTASDVPASQCLESDSQFTDSGWVYNFGTQWDFSETHGLRFFQYGNPGHWVAVPGVPLPNFVAAPVKFTTESEIDTVAHTVTRVAITVDGKRYPIGLVLPAFNSGSTSRKYTAAVQLDTKGGNPPVGYGVFVADFEERYL